MPAYLVVEINVHDAETYERYKQMAPGSIALHGGRYLVRGGGTQTLEGTWHPSRFVILEFPTVQHAQTWWDCAEYAPAKALRQASASTGIQQTVVRGSRAVGGGGVDGSRHRIRAAQSCGLRTGEADCG